MEAQGRGLDHQALRGGVTHGHVVRGRLQLKEAGHVAEEGGGGDGQDGDGGRVGGQLSAGGGKGYFQQFMTTSKMCF